MRDLKVGLTALEERARSELGMVGASETFYQVVTTAHRRLPPLRRARTAHGLRPRAMTAQPAAARLLGRSFRPRAAASASRPPAPACPNNTRRCAGATVLEWSLRALLAEPRIERIVVVLAADDARWPATAREPRSDRVARPQSAARVGKTR